MFAEHIEDKKQYMINITLYYFDHRRHISNFPHLLNKKQCCPFLDIHEKYIYKTGIKNNYNVKNYK